MATTAPKVLDVDNAEGWSVSLSPDGTTATFTVDLTKPIGWSSSGKSVMIAKTRTGKASIPGTDITVNFSVYRTEPAEAPKNAKPLPVLTAVKAAA